MARAGRVGDTAQSSIGGKEDDNGEGVEAASGSPDVMINGHAALRVGDPGGADGGAGPSGWTAEKGSTGVWINGRPAFRHGDATKHGEEEGELAEGSPDVYFGEARGHTKERPHDRAVTLDVHDATGRPIHDVVVSVFCPHKQRDDVTVHGSTTVGDLCRGAIVTVHKALQVGEHDEGVSHGPGHAHHRHHHLKPVAKPDASGGAAAPDDSSTPAQSGSAAASADDSSSPAQSGPAAAKLIDGTGGAPAPDVVVHAPAPSGTTTDNQPGVHLPSPTGTTHVKLATVHNYVELIYRAFGHHMPTGPREVALLGIREASLRAAVPGTHLTRDQLEKDAAAGDLEDVSFTREHRAPAYNDLLICVWTDKNVHSKQHVDVFECSIDTSPGHGLLHLPFLVEGQVFHATPGPYNKKYPGHNVALHVFHGMHEHHEPKGTTAEHVCEVAMKERGHTEHPPFSNRQKYGAWYGDNGAYWCAQFVSWVFAHAGMPQIHYEGCITGAGMFQNGSWGTWHGGAGSHAEPGDIVFYDFPGEQKYDHTGIVMKDNGSTITTVEGNTSAEGGSGSQSNGGGVYLRHRPKDGTIIGFGRPHFKKPHHEPGAFIRWGGEGGNANQKSFANSTVLHHHYFKKDHHGHNHPDPAATRYKRFMQIYNHAENKKAIPYLIVSSHYIRTYADWVNQADLHPTKKPGPRSVILESGLYAPKGHAHHYLPSFISPKYAEKIMAHARHMHDEHKAHKLREALMAATFKLKI